MSEKTTSTFQSLPSKKVEVHNIPHNNSNRPTLTDCCQCGAPTDPSHNESFFTHIRAMANIAISFHVQAISSLIRIFKQEYWAAPKKGVRWYLEVGAILLSTLALLIVILIELIFPFITFTNIYKIPEEFLKAGNFATKTCCNVSALFYTIAFWILIRKQRMLNLRASLIVPVLNLIAWVIGDGKALIPTIYMILGWLSVYRASIGQEKFEGRLFSMV